MTTMRDIYREYWVECIECSFEEHGITATREQIECVAADVEGASDNKSLAFGPPPGGKSQLQIDLEEANRKLEEERSKVFCRECNGSGRIYTQGPYHGSDTDCWKCNGEGKRLP